MTRIESLFERDRSKLLVLVCVGAVMFRVALYLSGLVEVVYDTYDSWEYRDLARSMLNHGTFGLDGVPRMNRQPGYPGFLALVFWLFGESRLAVSAAQVLIDALTCVMVVHIALVMRLRRAAVVTVAVLAVTCLYTAVYSMMMMTEVFYTFLIVASAWLLMTSPVPARDTYFNATAPRVMLSAAALGCGILVRPGLAPATGLVGALVLLTGIVRAWKRRNLLTGLAQPCAFGLVLLAIVVPWMLRNYVVFRSEFAKPDNDQVTLLGYKTDIPTYRHWYSKQFIGYLYSNEEPFVMIRPYRPPEMARYVYGDERADLERAFAILEPEILGGVEPIKQSTLDRFQRVTEQRYRAAPRLYVTGPVSRALKLWIAPRISAFWADTSGHNSTLTMIAGFTLYNLLYVMPGMIGVVWGLRQKTRVGFLFVVAMIIGHTWMYSVWLPMPQSRYAIPMFPLLALGAGALLDGWDRRWR